MALIDISKFKDRKTVVTSAYKDTSLKQAKYPYHEFCQELSKLSAKSFSEYHTRFARIMYEDALNGEDSELFRFAYNAIKGKRNIAPFKDKHKLAVHVIDKAMPLFHADNFIRVNYMNDTDVERCIRASAITLKQKSEGLPISMNDILSKFVIPYMREFVLPRIELTNNDKKLFDSEDNYIRSAMSISYRNMANGVCVMKLPISSANDSPKVNTYYLPNEEHGDVHVNDVDISYVGTLTAISTAFNGARYNTSQSINLRFVDSDIYEKLDIRDNVIYKVIKDISKALSKQGIIPKDEYSKEKLIDAFIGIDTRNLPSSSILLHVGDIQMKALLDRYEQEQIYSWYKRIAGFHELDEYGHVKLSSSGSNAELNMSLYTYADLYEYMIDSPSEDADVEYVFKNRVISPLKSAIGDRIYNSMTEGILSLLEFPLKTDKTPWLKIIDNIYGVNYQELDKYDHFIGFRTPHIYSHMSNNKGLSTSKSHDVIKLTYADRIETKFNF